MHFPSGPSRPLAWDEPALRIHTTDSTKLHVETSPALGSRLDLTVVFTPESKGKMGLCEKQFRMGPFFSMIAIAGYETPELPL